MIQRIAALVLTLAVLLLGTAPVRASETPDPNRPGSITFCLDWDGQPLEGGSLSLYQVGRLALVEGEYHFLPVPKLENAGLSLKDPSDPALAEAFAALVAPAGLEPVTAPISRGKAEFTGLVPGVYLVLQQEATPGFDTLRCFLISLPVWTDGSYLYDLTVEPKVSLEPLATEPTETQPPPPTVPPEPNLPQTGQLNWPVPVLCVGGAFLFALGWYLSYGKRGRHGS